MRYKPKHMRIEHPNATKNFSVDILEKDLNNFDKYYFNDNRNDDTIFREYLAVCKFWEHCFFKSDYLYICGNFETFHGVFMDYFKDRIKAHPILWKIFRMIFAV